MDLYYVSWAMLPCQTANSLQTMKMCHALAEAGANVTLLHPAYSANPYGPADGLWEYYNVPRDAFTRIELRSLSYRLGLARSLGRTKGLRLTQSRAYRRWLARHAGEGCVVYSRDKADLPWLTDLRRRRGFKLVFETHAPPTGTADPTVALCREVDLVVPISEHLAELFREAGVPGERILVEHDGFDPAEFADLPARPKARAALGIPPDDYVVGYVGGFRYVYGDKGMETLVDAVARLLPERRLRLCLVGGSPQDAEELIEHAAAAGLAPPVLDCRGRADREQLRQFLAAFDVCAHPLPDNELNRCQSPLKIFEYMAAGRAIVATDLAGMREVLVDERNALLVPPSDAAGLSAALARLHDDPALRARLGDTARADVARHRWPERARRILERVR